MGMENEKDALLVLSGGMDSVTMLHEYIGRIALCVNFSYGSNHNAREAECARINCRRLGVELVEIDLAFIAAISRALCLRVATQFRTVSMARTICFQPSFRSATA